MRLGFALLTAALALSACEQERAPEPKPTGRPQAPHHDRDHDRGDWWNDDGWDGREAHDPHPLYPRPDCEQRPGRIGQMICDDKGLDWLDRSLRKQWAEAREGASRRELYRIDRDQHRFLRDRRRCEDAQCLFDVYHRYLDPIEGDAPDPAPTPTSRPRPHPTKVIYRPHRDRHGHGRKDRNDHWEERGGKSCASQAGPERAQRLASQCARVNRGAWYRSCSVKASCATLDQNIRRGCNETYDKPGFCPTLFDQ